MPEADRVAPKGGRRAPAPDRSGHRQRLRERFLKDGGASLPDYELLELLLTGALPRRDTKPLAKVLLKRFGSFAGVVSAETGALQAVDGLGEAAAALLKCVRAAAVRLAREEAAEQPVLSSWERVIAYYRANLAHETVEHFHLLFLDRKLQLIGDEAQQRGTVDHTPLYPREVIRRALELGASALILVHNHPSGDPTPSRDDIDITREVISAGKPLGIAVHDHLVIGKHGHASLKGLGLI
jgi:DNA repair protein RadC